MSEPESEPQSETQPQRMEFTDPEKRFLENMWVGFKAPPEIDMHKVAAQMNMNHRSCGNIWGKLKKKIAHNIAIDAPGSPAAASSSTPTAATKTSPTKRKRAGAAQDGDEEAGTASPTKKPRAPRAPRGTDSKARGGATARGKGKGKAALSEAKAEDDEEESPDATPKKEESDQEETEAKVDATEAAEVAGEV
ncbi:hypothetical protein V8F20_005341 [Naviculisporaceae sp. PSN 640]